MFFYDEHLYSEIDIVWIGLSPNKWNILDAEHSPFLSFISIKVELWLTAYR